MISSIFRSILFGLHKKETPVLEHDIKIIADVGYNGIIAINNSQVTCNYDSANDFWYWDKPSNLTITSLTYFCCADTRSSVYNEQSKYIKEIYFSENVCTSTCTTLDHFFNFYNTTCNIEYADVSKFDTSNVTNLNGSFGGGGCKIDNIHGYENWNTANVTDFNYCFASDYITNNIDLHNWIVNSSATVTAIFPATAGLNFSVFYTPSKWDSNKRAFATLRHDLCIYPYHKINVVANSGFNGKIWNNSTSSFDDLTYDNSLGYWYSDSNMTDLKCALTYGSGSWQNTTALNITSASFKNLTITGNQGVREIFNKDTNLRSVAFVNCDLKSVNDGAFCVAETNCTSITGINELGKNSTAFLYAFFYNRNTSIVSSFVPEITTNRFDSSYIGCSALVNLTFADGFILQNGANTTNALAGCTALTTIKGNNFTLLETLNLSACPLTLNSAKVILRALGTVTSETISFSTTTWGYILADDEAIELLETAYSNGWNSNEPDIQVVAQSGYNGIVRLNNADKQLTNISGTEVWYGTAPSSVTSMDYFAKHASGSYYNSTSIYIKKVRFGDGMYAKTSNCTSLFAAFYCGGVDASLLSKIDVSNLNTSSVTNMQSVFADISINTISNGVTIVGYEDWNTSNVTNFNYCFGSVYIENDTIDLHKWHVRSNATIVSMFGGLVTQANYGFIRKIYYTPGYWAKDPMNDSNLAADRVKPVVYPYHDITISATSSFNGNVRINETNIATTKDNNLGIWYYDIPSQGELTQINLNYGSSSKAYITSISIGDRFTNQENQINTWSAFADCASLRTVRIPEGLNVNLNQTFRGSGLSTHVLCGVYGFDKIKNQSISGGEWLFRNQKNMYYVNLGKQTFTTYFNYAFNNCTNLRRISNFPGIENTASATTPMTGCTNLTYIDASGPISETLSFADCPLNVASAKVILNALQTVSGKTLTFSSTTKTAINADTEAKNLVTQARNRGWTISL